MRIDPAPIVAPQNYTFISSFESPLRRCAVCRRQAWTISPSHSLFRSPLRSILVRRRIVSPLTSPRRKNESDNRLTFSPTPFCVTDKTTTRAEPSSHDRPLSAELVRLSFLFLFSSTQIAPRLPSLIHIVTCPARCTRALSLRESGLGSLTLSLSDSHVRRLTLYATKVNGDQSLPLHEAARSVYISDPASTHSLGYSVHNEVTTGVPGLAHTGGIAPAADFSALSMPSPDGT
jgi:hypothetical protein